MRLHRSSSPAAVERSSMVESGTSSPSATRVSIAPSPKTRTSPFHSVSAVSVRRSSSFSTTARPAPESVRIQSHWSDDEVS